MRFGPYIIRKAIDIGFARYRNNLLSLTDPFSIVKLV